MLKLLARCIWLPITLISLFKFSLFKQNNKNVKSSEWSGRKSLTGSHLSTPRGGAGGSLQSCREPSPLSGSWRQRGCHRFPKSFPGAALTIHCSHFLTYILLEMFKIGLCNSYALVFASFGNTDFISSFS